MSMTRTVTPITGTKAGRADYSGEIHRSKQIMGYALEEGESILWLFEIAQEVPGNAAWTRGPITAAEDWVDVNEVTTNTSPYAIQPGIDYILKEFWMSWNQPAEFQLLQGGEATCRIESDAYTPTPINAFQTGWARGLLENRLQSGFLRLQVRNLGYRDMLGKIWIIGQKKTAPYIWW